jgi:hypothetical protein
VPEPETEMTVYFIPLLLTAAPEPAHIKEVLHILWQVQVTEMLLVQVQVEQVLHWLQVAPAAHMVTQVEAILVLDKVINLHLAVVAVVQVVQVAMVLLTLQAAQAG